MTLRWWVNSETLCTGDVPIERRSCQHAGVDQRRRHGIATPGSGRAASSARTRRRRPRSRRFGRRRTVSDQPSVALLPGGHQASVDDQFAAWRDHSEWAPRQPEFTMPSSGDRHDLEVPAGLVNPGVEFERDRLVASEQGPSHSQRVVLQDYRVGGEADLRPVLGVEEIGRAQMIIALAVAGLQRSRRRSSARSPGRRSCRAGLRTGRSGL